jgi:hypothetical protein
MGLPVNSRVGGLTGDPKTKQVVNGLAGQLVYNCVGKRVNPPTRLV